MAATAVFKAWDAPSTSAQGLRRYEQLSQAMRVAREYLYPRDITSSRAAAKPVESPEVAAAFAIVVRDGRSSEVYQDFKDAVETRFHLVYENVVPYIHCLQQTDDGEAEANQVMVDLLDRLALWQRAWGTPLRALKDTKRISTFTAQFHTLLHASLPFSFPSHFRAFLLSSLNAVSSDYGSHPTPRLKSTAPSPHFSRLGVLPRYSGTLHRVALEEIEKIAREEADKGWEVRRLGRARQRVGEGVAGWLGGMFEGNEAAQQAIRPMFSRFDYNLCKSFFDIRTDELFDIIVDYPDSLAALEDLRECLFKVDQRALLVNKLNAANQKRLLHPGAETKDVIRQYISTIRSLRILDPPGVLLHKIAEPIRKHLRERTDTIRCIVGLLVEGEDLNDENEAGGLIGEQQEGVERFGDPRWDPEPVDAAPEFRSGKASDIVSTLVSIYETREAIIKELQALLATRLLAVRDFDAVREIRTIEVLKIRFGENALGVCDVMLKDMADSKRIDDRIQGDISTIVHPLVVSRMFWPNLESSALRLGPKLERAANEYEAAFHHFKPDKHLRWLQQLGTATISLELEDRTVEVEATPLQASLIELFEETDTWTIEDLVERLGAEEEATEAGLAFWKAEGVVREDGGKWVLLERAE